MTVYMLTYVNRQSNDKLVIHVVGRYQTSRQTGLNSNHVTLHIHVDVLDTAFPFLICSLLLYIEEVWIMQ